MTATDELRRLLDERGVEHVDYGGKGHEDEVGRPATWWSGEHGECTAVQRDDVRLLTVEVFLTPEQAVEATLGRGTCEVEGYDDGMDEGMDGEWFAYAPPTWYLSCGHEGYGSERPRYCSVCGKRVVEP